MTKLHELLAVNNSLEGQTAKCVGDLKETFSKKHHLFTERSGYHPKAQTGGTRRRLVCMT